MKRGKGRRETFVEMHVEWGGIEEKYFLEERKI